MARDNSWKQNGDPHANGKWSAANVHQDGTNLDLSLTNADGQTPVAAEIISTRSMGYGTYEMTFKGDFSTFDKYTVFGGFFTFDWSYNKDDGYREIDAMEISRWGGDTLKGLTTYYPYTNTQGVGIKPENIWPDSWTHATAKLEWTPNKITWSLRNADTGEEFPIKEISTDIIKPANQQIHSNIWTLHTDAGWPANTPQKVTLESFSYAPLKDDGSNHSNTPEPPNGQPTPQPPQANHAGSVTITGDAKVGGELKATVSDEDGVPQDGIKYQWQRDGADIKDATGATYKLTADDAGHKISVKAEYQDNGKHAEAPTSDATEIPQDTPNHAPTGSVTISGMAQAGQTLHAGNTLADEDGMGQVNYQWLRDGKEISGATGGQYTLTADDVGHDISVRASYTDGKAHAESKDGLSSLKPAAEGTAPTYEQDYGEPTVDWAGFKWVARGGGFKEGGPQANHQWSKDNAHLDGTNMELSITNADKHTPVASEIVSTRAMGYGTYEATFHADFSKFDKYSVFGFFTFDWSQDKVDDGYREIDAVEISRWGDSVLKGTTTYYPHTSEKGVHPQPDSVWPENWTHGTVKLEWTPQKISWTLRNADTGEEVTKDITSDIVKPANQQMHFNLWTYKPDKDTKTDGWQDSAATDPQKVTLESFSYTPLKDDGSNHSNTPEPPKDNLEHTTPALQHSGDDVAHHDSAHAAALHHSAPQALHEAGTVAQHHHGSDGHDVLASDGIDVATYSGLMNLDGAALLSHLGEHSAELLAASQHSSNHALHGGAGDDVLIAGHGAALLEGGAGADTFAYLLDSNNAASWHEPSRILDFNPAEGDRIVLAGGDHVKAEVSSDAGGQHLHVTDAAGHVRTIDIASGNGKTLTAEDILSHVDIQTSQPSYEPSAYSVPQTPHLPQDDHSHLI